MCLASDLKQEVQKMVNIFHTDVIEVGNCTHHKHDVSRFRCEASSLIASCSLPA
jgi:hypothetical protein